MDQEEEGSRERLDWLDKARTMKDRGAIRVNWNLSLLKVEGPRLLPDYQVIPLLMSELIVVFSMSSEMNRRRPGVLLGTLVRSICKASWSQGETVHLFSR